MLVCLLVKMLCILVLCPVLLAAGVQTLSIDSQLGTSIEDCFERISIGEQLPVSAVYRNVSELTTRECEHICKQDKQCQTFDYGVGAKGNATCDLSNVDEKELKEKSLLNRHPDYDVYVRRFQCEQSPPTPMQPQNDDPGDGPSHRPVFRPEVDEPKRPLADYPIDSRPYETSDRPYYPNNRPYRPPHHNYLDDRPDDYFNQKPDYDRPPSYGAHKPQDIPFKPERPIKKPDPYDVLQFQDQNGRPTHRPGSWRPDPNYPPRPSDEISDIYGPKPTRPNDSPPYRPDEKPQFTYIIRPNRKPSIASDDTGYGNKPSKPVQDYPTKPDPYGQNDHGPISQPDRPYKPNRPNDYPYRPHERPSYDYHGQYASNYGQNQYHDQDNSIYVEIYDPPRPYRPSRPLNDRPMYGTSQGSYGQDYGHGGSGIYGYGSYSSHAHMQSQNSQDHYYGSGNGNSPLDDQNYNRPQHHKPQKPDYDVPSSSYGSQTPQQFDQSFGSQSSGYGSQTSQKPQDAYNKPVYGNHGSYGSNQSLYGSTQSSYGSSQSTYGGQSEYSSTQSSYGSSNRPSYGSTQGYGLDNSHQSSYGGSQSHGSSHGSYGNNKPSDEFPSYGNNKPSYSNNRPSYGDDRPSYGDNRPSYEDNRPSYGDNRPSYGDNRPVSDNRPTYGESHHSSDDRPLYGDNRPSSDNRPSYGANRPTSDNRPSYGNNRPTSDNRPTYGGHRPLSDNRPSYGDNRPSYGDERPSYGSRPPYGGNQPPYDSDRPDGDLGAYGNNEDSQGYGQTDYKNDRYGNKKPSNTGYQKPSSNGYQKPVDTGYQKPTDSGYQKPVENGYHKPSDNGYQKPIDTGYQKPVDTGYQKPGESGYQKPDKPNETDYYRPDVRPVYEYELEKPGNVPSYIIRPNGEVVTSRPMTIGDYGGERPGDRPGYGREPGLISYEACFRRVLAGKRAVRSHVRKVVPCERLEDCRRECGTERRFHCESFNYRYEVCAFFNSPNRYRPYHGTYFNICEETNMKSVPFFNINSPNRYRTYHGTYFIICEETSRLDPSFRGKGLCEMMTKPIEAFDLHRDFVEDKDYDFYELDRNSLEPNCPETLRGPGILHSGFLTSKPNRIPVYQSQRPGWSDRSDWGDRNRNRFHDDRGGDRNFGRRRYEDRVFIPYQIGIGRSNEDQESWGQYGGYYGGNTNYYKDRNDYHKSINHWGLSSIEPPEYGVKPILNSNFNYRDLGKKDSRYAYGSWKRGRWNTGGSGNGLDYGESNYYKPMKPQIYVEDRSDEVVLKDCSSRRSPGMSLGSGAIRRSLLARNVVECEAACFNEREFKCVSYSYRYSNSHGTDNCFLSERPYRGLDLSADSGSDVYAMPQDQGCTTISHKPWVESECFWHVRSGAAVSGSSVRAALTVAGLGACEAECIRAHAFFCRGFSFRFDSPTIGDDLENCILTSSPPTSLEAGRGLRSTIGHELYSRGNYGRGCEPALYDDIHQRDAQNPKTECYLQYDNAAKLIGSAIRGQARVRDEEACGMACTEAPFRCLSFSFNNNAPDTDNCLLSEIRLFDLQRGVDYEHSADDWLFAFDLFNGQCWRKVHGKEDYDEPALELPRPLSHPVEDYPSSGPSGPPGYLPAPPEPPYIPGSGPPSGPGYKPSYSEPKPFKPAGPGYLPEGQRPYLPKPGYLPEPSYPETSRPFRPDPYPPAEEPEYRPVNRPGYLPESGPGYPEPSGPGLGPVYPADPGLRPGYPGGPSGPGLRPGYPAEPSGPGLRPGYPAEPSGPVLRPGYPAGPSGPVLRPGYPAEPSGPGFKPVPVPSRPGYGPEKPYPGDREEPIAVSWQHYTVSGFPCRQGTTCAQNQVAGHWACEPEGGEIGSWDYCCAPTHRCGYSEGFHKPWCYVGPTDEQWRPCSEKYYPYHQHNIPHPSQGGHRGDTPRNPTRPWNRPASLNDRDRPRPYMAEGDRKYWDGLYKNGPQAYYDKYGNPLPGYTRVPTAERPYIKYSHNYPRPGAGQWMPVTALQGQELDPPLPGGLGVPRYWPVAYLHKGPPPNMTYFKYNETERTTTTEKYDPRPTNLPKERPPAAFNKVNPDRPSGNNIDNKNHRDEKTRNITNANDDVFSIDLDKLKTTTTPKTEVKEVTEKVDKEIKNETQIEIIKLESDNIDKESEKIKGIDGKIDDLSKSIEVLDIEDAKKGEKIADLKTLEAEERQIEAIGRLLASRRGGKLVLEKRSQKDLDTKSIAIDKDLVDFNFGNRFPTTERRGIIQKVTKDEIEKERNIDKSLEVSETTFVRPPRVLSTTENIRKAIINGKVFYDATIREQRDIITNSTRKPKSLRPLEERAPSIISNSNYGKKKVVRARQVNPVRKVRRVYRRKYNPEEVRRRLLERDRSMKQESNGESKKL